MSLWRALLCMLIVLPGGGASGNVLVDMFTDWDPSWPQRFGVTGVGYTQEQDYVVGNVEIMLGQFPVPSSAIGSIENEITQLGVKADFWVLPFWNIHGLVGAVDGMTTVTPAVPLFSPIEVNYDGVVYGVGTTLAYGQDWWFASVSGVITETELESGMSSVKAWLITPKIGIRTERIQIWVGATYQNVDERQMGTFDVPGLGVANYDIQLEAAEEWNAQVGVRYAVSDSVFVTVEGGFGNRESLLGHLEFRFW